VRIPCRAAGKIYFSLGFKALPRILLDSNMGMLKRHIHLLAMERQRHPVRGRVLTLGQQSVYATLPKVRKILQNRGVPMATLPEGFDTTNKIPAWKGTWWGRNTNAQTVLSLMGAKEIVVTDASDYEGAELLLNLNDPIPDNLTEQFDVILDIGTLEHLFDVPTALANLVKMLKTGGDLVLILPASNSIDHGFYTFSPSLLFDYFRANGFDGFDCYLMAGPVSFFIPRRVKVYKYQEGSAEYLLATHHGGVEMAFFATKRESRAVMQKPIQSRYVKSAYWAKAGVNMVAEGSFLTRYKKIFLKARGIISRDQNLTYHGKF
jgi:SAM-dependent methyltransferase